MFVQQSELTSLAALGPDEILRRLEASGLRGRGGGWFPAARKWRAVRVEGGAPVVVANGAEGEPGSIKDRWVMRREPEAVLSGLRLAAAAVGASETIVYLKAGFDEVAAALERARAHVPFDGVSLSIRLGDDRYVGGEETAALEFLEGRRAWPRPKPPLPAAVGLFGRPTLVQNVETLARVLPAIAAPEAFRLSDSVLVSLWGHVRRPGVVEVPLGTPIGRVIDEHGGGAIDGVSLVFPAGPSAAPLGASDLDAPLDPDALRARGSGLGTAALLVVGASACPLSVAASLSAFYEVESCGQCPPCVVGTASLARVVRGVEAGGTRAKDLGDLGEAAGFMSDHGYCAHARTAAAAVTRLLDRVRPQVEEHLRHGGCPRPEQRIDPFGAGSPERRAIEDALVRAVAA